MNINQVTNENSEDSTTTVSLQVVNVTYKKPEKEYNWLWLGGLVLILFVLLWIIGINNVIQYQVGKLTAPQVNNQIQTNIVEDHLYITND